jgi:hypothetical protein
MPVPPPPAQGSSSVAALAEGLAAAGLAWRGGFHPEPADGVPPLPDGRAAATLILAGTVGSAWWQRFAAAPEAGDGAADPLDRWSRRLLSGLAARHGAVALFPFGGPPWLPFQRWAARAEPVAPSPLGILIHPEYGLWHAYRGALAFAERLGLPPPAAASSPCESCRARPCLGGCPVGAFGAGGYDVPRCVAHLAGPAGAACVTIGCQARLACPVGADYRYGPSAAAFHMGAFLRARRGQNGRG